MLDAAFDAAEKKLDGESDGKPNLPRARAFEDLASGE